MRVATRPRTVAGWVNGVAEDAEPGVLEPGALAEGENFVPTPAGRLRTRGGSRIVATLHDDAGTPANVDHVCVLAPFTNVGALAVAWSNAVNKHFAYRLTVDMDFATGSEATSRVDLTAAPSGTWDNASAPARPVLAEVFEKMYLCDATVDYATRNELLAIDSAGTVTSRTFQFGAGAAAELYPYCIEEYNGVLFIAGYGTEDASDGDRPEMLRHSFLGKSPDAADGFDADAWVLIGAKGQRITALRKGNGYLLVAKSDELYRVSGFGRAYAGWQYQVTRVTNTKGLGITNPHALTFAEGYWWGVSQQGPIRTDGFNVESLVGPRLRSWMGIDDTEYSWVTYHPERRLILFGLHPLETSGSRSATYPWRVWAWDLVRDVWQPDHLFGTDLFYASPVTPVSLGSTSGGSTPTAPSAPPSSPSTGSETTTGYTASWTNGDASAETEFWEKEGSGGTWSLVTVIAAGTASYPRTGRTNHTSYYWRVRHKKGAVYSAYTADTLAQTLIAAPDITATRIGNTILVTLTIVQNADGTDVEIEKNTNSAGWVAWGTITALAEGTHEYTDFDSTCSDLVQYRALSSDASWPTTDSATDTSGAITLTAPCEG